jgi:bifunctional ADP-heptose synthase (sugar kinase/adenylyltransferase)
MDTRAKIVDASQISSLLARSSSNGRRLVVARGWFDVLRASHCRALAEAKASGSELVVIVHADGGAQPTLLNAAARAQLAAAIAVVDYVVICDGTQARNLAASWNAAAIVEIDESFSRGLVENVLQRYRPA